MALATAAFRATRDQKHYRTITALPLVLGQGGARHVATLKALVEAGANVNIADRAGATPLTLAKRRRVS